MTILTQENYYQDRTHLTNSRVKAYASCEARAAAIDHGVWEDLRDDTPLLLGNYVHSYFESPKAHQEFLAEHGDKLLSKTGKNKGKLKADFVIGDAMIKALDTDPSFGPLYHGYPGDEVIKEMIVYGDIDGVPVKGKLDSVNLSRGYFVDLKTMRSIYTKEWNEAMRTKVPAAANNILGYGYHGQLALYQELLKQMTGRYFRPVIVAVSKEAVPDKEVLTIDEAWLAEGLEQVSQQLKRVWELVDGQAEPVKCGRCDYCRSVKTLGRVVSLSELLEVS